MADNQIAPIASVASPALAVQTEQTAAAQPKEIVAETAEQKPKPDQATERRAEALARAKRHAASLRAQEEKLKLERAAWQAEQKSVGEALKAKQQLDQLAKLQKEDPVKFLETIGLDFNHVSKEYIKRKTGAGLTPAELAEEAVNRKLAEKESADRKAAADREAIEAKKRDDQTIAGVRRQLGELIRSEPDRFDLISDDPTAIDRAWGLCVDFYTQTVDPRTGVGKQLDFAKALDAVETEARNIQRARLTRKTSKQLWDELQKEAKEAEEKAAKAAATKPNVSSAKTSGAATRTEAVATPTLKPPESRFSRRPQDIRKAAAQLWAEHLAKSDN